MRLDQMMRADFIPPEGVRKLHRSTSWYKGPVPPERNLYILLDDVGPELFSGLLFRDPRRPTYAEFAFRSLGSWYEEARYSLDVPVVTFWSIQGGDPVVVPANTARLSAITDPFDQIYAREELKRMAARGLQCRRNEGE